MPVEIECLIQIRTELGEGPLWSQAEQALYWLDCLKPAVYRYDPATGENRALGLPLDSAIGALAFRRGGGYVLALESGVALLDRGAARTRPLAHPEHGREENRYNDGKPDRSGRLFLGSLNKADRDPTGALYRIDPDGRCAKLDHGFVCANGMDWSPDGGRFYFVDSGSRNIYAYDYDAATGALENRRVFAAIAAEEGSPDGLTVDREGGVWVAHWDGWCISRFDPSGRRDRRIKMPVPRPTSLCFGGPGFDRLYVTSAGGDLPAAALSAAPLSGSLFALEPGVAGFPPNSFG